MTLVPTNERKEIIKKYEGLWSKFRDSVSSITQNYDDDDDDDDDNDDDKRYVKIKFNSDDELPLNKTIEIPSMIIVVRAVFMKIINFIHKYS